MRVFALSDTHMDYPDNRRWVDNLSAFEYKQDALLLAGDLTHDPDRLEESLSRFLLKFARVFFVPGNHELWTLKSNCRDSLEKFHQVMEICKQLGVRTAPERLGLGSGAVWVVPLFSWYEKPEEGEGSLFVNKKGEDPTLQAWSDNYFIKWPPFPEGQNAAGYFLSLNQPHVTRNYDAPVISLSHFLPRKELMFPSKAELERRAGTPLDSNQSFNFSRVAGTAHLDRQIRLIGSRLHVYGHQHRNRTCLIEGVTYVSHCLGYAHERKKGQVIDLEKGPRLLWDGEWVCRAEVHEPVRLGEIRVANG